MIWASVSSFLLTNWLRLLQIGAACLAVIWVISTARASGKLSQKVDQYDQAIKIQKVFNSLSVRDDRSVEQRLREGGF